MDELVVRTIGIARARTKIGLANLAYNMKRLARLKGDHCARIAGKPTISANDQPKINEQKANPTLEPSAPQPPKTKIKRYFEVSR